MDGDRLLAVGARPARAHPASEGVAVGAALDAQGPGPAGLALVDRGGPGQAGREGCRCPLKGPPRPLAAGGRAVALPAGRDEATPAGGAGHRRGVVAHGAHAASLRALRSAS